MVRLILEKQLLDDPDVMLLLFWMSLVLSVVVVLLGATLL